MKITIGDAHHKQHRRGWSCINSISGEKIEQDADLRLDWLNPDGILSFDRYKYIFPN